MARFDHFVAIDWSGARGARQKGIAIAVCLAEGGPPVLVQPDRGWSRAEVADLLRKHLPANSLVGMDLGISLPFTDCGAFFPGADLHAPDAKALWAMIDRICADDPHLEATSLVDHPVLAEFFRRHGGREGEHFRCDGAEHGRGRFRKTEHAQAAMGCKPYSNFNLVGAAQVGKSSLTGMRMLHQLGTIIPVWPIDPLPEKGSVIVEIYTALAALEAQRSTSRSKVRNFEDLNIALAALGSPAVDGTGEIDDHSTDALITAAWLRKVADDPARWSPEGLTDQIARTEGWTFGAV
ncbi:hypothetical protein OAS19_02195 [Altererythrobacter sp.]|nr:hypothetical protein [Altererythrobacter sp.]